MKCSDPVMLQRQTANWWLLGGGGSNGEGGEQEDCSLDSILFSWEIKCSGVEKRWCLHSTVNIHAT
jgi:hypothetical protein